MYIGWINACADPAASDLSETSHLRVAGTALRSIVLALSAVKQRMRRLLPPLDRYIRIKRARPDSLDAFYAAETDPFHLDTNPYEHKKYDDLLAALQGRRYRRAWEIGCSIGSFTERLAGSCDQLLATEISQVAADRARERLRDKPQVQIVRQTFPVEAPAEMFDLIVCADMLYYLPEAVLGQALSIIDARLEAGGALVVLHYLGDAGAVLRGDDVHNIIERQFGSAWSHLLGKRLLGVGPHGAGYRLDRYDKPQHPTSN